MRVDAEVVVDRGQDVAVVDGVVARLGGGGVGGADNLAHLHAATGDNGTVHPRPVVAARALVDLWGAPELAPNHHGGRVIEAACVDVLDEGADALVEQ